MLQANALHTSPNRDAILSTYSEKLHLANLVKETKKKIVNAISVMHMDELKARKRVLRRLGFTDESDVIQMKGRVACEISTGDELLLTELIFNGVFNELTIPQTVALLSCFVFQEKSTTTTRLKDELKKPLQTMHEIARRIAKVSIESKVELVEEEYVNSFRPELMDVAFAWTNVGVFHFYRIC